MGLQHRAPRTFTFSTFAVFSKFSAHSCILKVWIWELVLTSWKIFVFFSRYLYFYRTSVCIPAFWMPRSKKFMCFSVTCSVFVYVLIKLWCFCMFWSNLAACAHSSLCLRRATSGGGWSSCQGPCEYYYSGLRENASWNNTPEPRFWTV